MKHIELAHKTKNEQIQVGLETKKKEECKGGQPRRPRQTMASVNSLAGATLEGDPSGPSLSGRSVTTQYGVLLSPVELEAQHDLRHWR